MTAKRQHPSGRSNAGRVLVLLATLALLGTGLAGCLSGNTPNSSNQVSSLSGSGSSFVAPLMQTWAQKYAQQSSVEVNYASIGSGGGQDALTKKTVDFAGSDAPLSDQQYQAFQADGGAVHVPESLGAVVPVFNIPGVTSLRLTGPVLAEIYLGHVTKWNDPAIQALNPNTTLPGHDIVVVHRSDASGTSFAFTDYLSRVSDAWKNGPGTDKAPNWPTGVGGKGNEGVSGVMKQQSYAIGYVELTYATENKINMVTMKNHDGYWVNASMDGAAAAASGAVQAGLPKGDASWASVSINDAPGKTTWPIATLTYIIMYKDMGKAYGGKVSLAQAKATLEFVQWAITSGQQYAPSLKYPALPQAVVTLDQQTLQGMTYNGQAILGSS